MAQKLKTAGYSSLHKLEADDGRYEVEARNPEGQRVELKVNPRSGDIVRSKRDDDDDDRWDD